MTLLDDCEILFSTRNLYEILEVEKSATQSDIKRAYYKLSLKVHPDRVDEKQRESSTKKFQVLSRVHCILSNEEARALYDESGEILDEEITDAQQDRDWSYYWRLLFPKVTVEDIEKFEIEYRGSDEEKNDLAAIYVQYKGDMDAIMENMICSRVEDETRYCHILDSLIQDGAVPKFKAYIRNSEKKKKLRQNKAKKEEMEAEKYKKQLGIDAGNDLKALILKRQNDRKQQSDDFLASLEAKYASQSRRGKRKK